MAVDIDGGRGGASTRSFGLESWFTLLFCFLTSLIASAARSPSVGTFCQPLCRPERVFAGEFPPHAAQHANVPAPCSSRAGAAAHGAHGQQRRLGALVATASGWFWFGSDTCRSSSGLDNSGTGCPGGCCEVCPVLSLRFSWSLPCNEKKRKVFRSLTQTSLAPWPSLRHHRRPFGLSI